MKKIILIILLLLFLMFPTSTQAHILKIDGDIGVILHIDPEDDPIAGEPSHFHLDFTDKTDKFRPEKCDCSVEINQKDKKIHTLKLIEENPNPNLIGISFMYTFPKKDVYKVVLEGKPREPGDFQAFSLEYDIRVGRDRGKIASANNLYNSTSIVVIVLGISVTFLTIMYILRIRRPKNV